MTTTLQRLVRLLVFTGESFIGGYGSATALRTFVQGVVTHTNWRLTVIAPRISPESAGHPSDRVRVLSIPVSRHSGRRTQLLQYAVRSRASAAEFADARPDAVISWQPMPAGLSGAIAARASGAPHVVRTCGPELARSWSRFPAATMALMPLTRCLLRRADAVVVKSDIERTLVGPLVKDGAHLIVNAVGREFFSVAQARHDTETRLLTVCQLERHKGVATLIAALATVRHRPWRLTVVGDGSQRTRLRRAAAAAGLRADFVGRLPHGDLPAVYSAHDAFVLPSTLEGCSNAALEAMAAGLPIIGNRSALHDLVDDGVTGFLSESPDERSFALAVKRFLEPGIDREAMRRAARQRATTHSPQRLVAEYGQLLDALHATECPSRSERSSVGKPAPSGTSRTFPTSPGTP